jgi:hypothetical protein
MIDSPRAMACVLLLAAACGGSSGTSVDAPVHTPGMPGYGAHGLRYYGLHTNEETSIATPSMTTQASGSTMIVSVGRGDITAFALPTDSKGNAPYRQLGDAEPYTHYPSSGTALYAFTSAKGSDNLTVSTTTNASDEVTLAAVEVVEGTQIQAFAWNEVVQPASEVPVTSHSVTTTGPATLVAFWWGDAPEPNDKTAVPNNDFKVIDSILLSGALVQCAVAVKNVSAAGTYDVTWAATPIQGAQLWLVAVQ